MPTPESILPQYNTLTPWFAKTRNKSLFEKPYLDQILNQLPNPAHILDLGCGTGDPIAKYFIENGHHITGIDGAEEMIARCKQAFPGQNWLLGDMRVCKLSQRFDAVLAWNSFFHLSHQDQRAMMPLFQRHVKPGGFLLFTVGHGHGEVISEMQGMHFYHASLAEDEYRLLLAQHGFDVLSFVIEDAACRGHSVCLARAGR